MSKPPKRKLRAAWELQNGKCCWCGEPVPLLVATQEHILPVLLGGDNSRNNLAAAHAACNKARGCNIWQDPHPSFLFGGILEKLKVIRASLSTSDSLKVKMHWSGDAL
jgi:hypothetical protein